LDLIEDRSVHKNLKVQDFSESLILKTAYSTTVADPSMTLKFSINNWQIFRIKAAILNQVIKKAKR